MIWRILVLLCLYLLLTLFLLRCHPLFFELVSNYANASFNVRCTSTWHYIHISFTFLRENCQSATVLFILASISIALVRFLLGCTLLLLFCLLSINFVSSCSEFLLFSLRSLIFFNYRIIMNLFEPCLCVVPTCDLTNRSLSCSIILRLWTWIVQITQV